MLLSWCGALLVLISDPFLWWWLSPIYSALVLLPNMSRKGFTTAGFERGQVVQSILTKVVFACEKTLAVTLRRAQ